VWRYSVATARWVFGDNLGDADALKVLAALEARPARRLTRVEVDDLFCGHRRPAEIDRVRDLLIRAGRIDAHRSSGPLGRPAERWTLRPEAGGAG
jgi:hypothetical protein